MRLSLLIRFTLLLLLQPFAAVADDGVFVRFKLHEPAGAKWFGTPAMPDRQMKRQILTMQELPELFRRVRAVERQLGIDATADEANGAEKS